MKLQSWMYVGNKSEVNSLKSQDWEYGGYGTGTVFNIFNFSNAWIKKNDDKIFQTQCWTVYGETKF